MVQCILGQRRGQRAANPPVPPPPRPAVTAVSARGQQCSFHICFQTPGGTLCSQELAHLCLLKFFSSFWNLVQLRGEKPPLISGWFFQCPLSWLMRVGGAPLFSLPSSTDVLGRGHSSEKPPAFSDATSMEMGVSELALLSFSKCCWDASSCPLEHGLFVTH